MAKQVFISHSSKDRDMAEAIYQYLTSQGIQCWMDIHDIRKGIPYAREIMRGIDGSDLLVVVYSRNVNNSEDILNEIDQFHTARKTIIPFLTDETPFSREVDYYLKRRQWITAYNNYRSQLPALRDAIAELLHLQLEQPTSRQSGSLPNDIGKPTQGGTTSRSTFDVVLYSAGAAKLQVVKAVKEVCGLDLKTAKDLVDNAPTVLAEDIDFASASTLKSYVEEAGATVEIKSSTGSADKRNSRPTVLFSVILVSVRLDKFKAVKVIKESLGISLKEAKDLVDDAPSILRQGIQPWEAQTLKSELETWFTNQIVVCSNEQADATLRMYKAAALSQQGDKYYSAGKFELAISCYLQAVSSSDKYDYYAYDCNRIAYAYCAGQGVTRDYYKAAKWFKIAAERGRANAQLNLGILYQNGDGVTKDLAEAARWYERAALQGDETAKKYLNELKQYLKQ